MNDSDDNNPENIDTNRRKVLIGGAGGVAAAYVGMGISLAAAAAGQSSASAEIKQPNYIPEDKFFGPAFIDIDEWRDLPVPHRYVHGGFKGTDTRLSLSFPPK